MPGAMHVDPRPHAPPRASPPSAEATQEICAEDVLEAADMHLPTAQAQREVSSIAPFAIDVRASDFARAPGESAALPAIPARRAPNPKLVATVGVALSVCILILVGAGIRTAVATTESGIAMPPVAARATTAPAGTAAQGAVGTDLLPPAPVSGTIVFPKRTSVVLDGARVSSSSAIVRCGDHTVRIGRAAARKVEVPCGGTVDLDKRK
jgi:hypothetical protein